MGPSYYKFRARQSLEGSWKIAILASLIASAFGAIGGSASFGYGYGGGGSSSSGGSDIPMDEGMMTAIVMIALVTIIFAFAIAVAQLVVGSAVWVGYSKFNLDLTARNKKLKLGVLFSYFKNLGNAFGTRFLSGLYIFLWSLLFWIPGIVASYSYAIAGFILAENPQLSPRDALSESKRLMKGRRWNLFCLDFSFIGWHLLCVLSLGIGYIWLVPYIQASYAEFYRQVKREEFRCEDVDFDGTDVLDTPVQLGDDSNLNVVTDGDNLEIAAPLNEENDNPID